jgi:hypothetical protein
LDGRSQSVQSLSPGVRTAGARSDSKKPERLRVERVDAGRGGHRARRPVACLEVSVVDRERDVLRVHVGDQVRHPDHRLEVRVREVSPEADGIAPPLIFAAFGGTRRDRAREGRRGHARSCRQQGASPAARHRITSDHRMTLRSSHSPPRARRERRSRGRGLTGRSWPLRNMKATPDGRERRVRSRSRSEHEVGTRPSARLHTLRGRG